MSTSPCCAGAGVEPVDVEVAKQILDAILSGHVEGAPQDDMEYEGGDDSAAGLNMGRCRTSLFVTCAPCAPG
jgi:hypothetical protein